MNQLTYEKNGKTVTLNKALANKINELLSCGLVSGLGSPEPGKMCVEAAVNFACGFDHGDEPICVGRAVRSFKIQLNDSKWSSNEARAKGMRKIAIAQLGSDKLNQVEFAEKLAFRTITILLPQILTDVGLEKEAKACAEAKDLNAAESAESAAKSAEYAAEYAEYAAEYAEYAAESAKYAAKSAEYAAKSAKYAAKSAKDAAKSAKYADKYLTIAADICFDVLKEMNSPGVEWVD